MMQDSRTIKCSLCVSCPSEVIARISHVVIGKGLQSFSNWQQAVCLPDKEWQWTEDRSRTHQAVLSHH